MATIDKLIKLLQKDDIVDGLDDEMKRQIVQDVILGVKIDDDSRSSWLDTNQEAMRIIKHCEDEADNDTLETPVYKAAKVIYPLLAPAVIQLASRIIQHVVRNERVVECAVLGPDQQVPENPQAFQQYQILQQHLQQNPQLAQQIQQSGQMPPPPKMIWQKADRARRVSDYMNYELLVESDTWLKDTHKLCHILSSWGTSFRQVRYDPVSKRIIDELISPEDVIINHNISSLDKAPRITIRHYMTKNDVIEQIRAGYFCDLSEEELALLDKQPDEKSEDYNEIVPASVVWCQYIYLDLDDDGYAEPYKVYVHDKLQLLLGVYPAFELNDVNIGKKGDVISIERNLDIIDDHLIDDPEGKFYSIGLNYLLLHQNKSITSILRQLLDAGSLANAGSCTGFITNAFKTRERNLEFQMGKFLPIDVNPNVNPLQHIIPLPVKEPSQVLLGLLEMLIQGGEKTGFITDVLMGDIQGQNVPATTILAMVEQGTRAFKPVIQKFWIARKKEFKQRIRLNAKYTDNQKYALYNGGQIQVSKEDFNLEDLQISPVADPTQSSESHKYAKMQFILQLLATQAMPAMNVQENLLELYKGMEFDNPERFVQASQPPPPDPKMAKVQLDGQKMQMEAQQKQQDTQIEAFKAQSHHQIQMLQTQIKAAHEKNLQLEATIKERELHVQQLMALESSRKNTLDAHKNLQDSLVKHKMAEVAKDKVEVDRIKANKPSNTGG